VEQARLDCTYPFRRPQWWWSPGWFACQFTLWYGPHPVAMDRYGARRVCTPQGQC